MIKNFDYVLELQERIANNIIVYRYGVEDDSELALYEIIDDYTELMQVLSECSATNKQIAYYLAGIITLL